MPAVLPCLARPFHLRANLSPTREGTGGEGILGFCVRRAGAGQVVRNAGAGRPRHCSPAKPCAPGAASGHCAPRHFHYEIGSASFLGNNASSFPLAAAALPPPGKRLSTATLHAKLGVTVAPPAGGARRHRQARHRHRRRAGPPRRAGGGGSPRWRPAVLVDSLMCWKVNLGPAVAGCIAASLSRQLGGGGGGGRGRRTRAGHGPGDAGGGAGAGSRLV